MNARLDTLRLDSSPTFLRTRVKPRLDQYSLADAPAFSRGRPAIVEALWMAVQALLVRSFIPGSRHRVLLLKLFGAKIGTGVVLKPGIRVKFPWRLTLGDHCWIGEDVWIDNLADVKIGAHAVVSQGAYLCTGSHNWNHPRFALITRPIVLKDHSWLCARASLAPGTVLEEGAVVGLGAVASGTLQAWTVYGAAPPLVAADRAVQSGEASLPTDILSRLAVH